MPEEKDFIIPPLYDRPGNLLRKMALMQRHIDDIQNMLDYYGWIFTSDPWFAAQLERAQTEYAQLEEQFNTLTKELKPDG